MFRILAVAGAAIALTACYTRTVYVTPDPVPPPAPPPVVEAEPPPPVVVEGSSEPRCVAEFSGEHPVPEEYGGGWCVVEGPHCHDYAPVQTSQYVVRDHVYYFGAVGISWSYDGPHPVPPEEGGGWCNVHGLHSHRYHPWHDFGYDRDRHVYVYAPGRYQPSPHPTYPSRQPIPYGDDVRNRTVPTSYPSPHPTYPSHPSPQPTYPSHPSPQPTYPQPATRQPIPYGDDVHTHVVEPPVRPLPPSHPTPPVVRPTPGPPAHPGPVVRPNPWTNPNPEPARPTPGSEGAAYHPTPVGPRPGAPAWGTRPTSPVGAERPNPRPIPNPVRPGDRVSNPVRVLPAQQGQRKQERKNEKRRISPTRGR